MKQLKSCLTDLRHIFARTITLRDIAEPLVSFDEGRSAPDLCAFMEKRGFDVVGVRAHGIVAGYIARSDLALEEPTSSQWCAFAPDEVLPDSEPLLSAFAVLQERRHVFIRVLGHVGGIVTRGDLQKAPVRMWLFGLMSLLEMQMLRLIRERYPADSWTSMLTENRVAYARRIFDERHRHHEESDLSDCLQLIDKGTIIKNDADLFCLTGFTSKESLQSFFVKVVKLRDTLAHANSILGGRWPETVELVRNLEALLERIEKATGKMTPHISI